MEALRKPEPLSFEGNVAENWKNFEAEFDIVVQAAYGDKDERTKAYILFNLAGREAIEKEKTFTYATEVTNDAGDVVQPAESRENITVLKAKFTELCNPLTNVIIERHKFNSRVQQQSEPVQNFITSLKILSYSCEYGPRKDSLIRDRIVCGVSSDTLRRQLLKERELTLHRAIQMCQIHETADAHTTQVTQAHNTQVAEQAEVRVVRHSSLRKDKSYIYCGRLHPRKKELCPAFGKICSACSKPNHFAKVCKTTSRKTSGRINVVDIEDPETSFEIEALTQISQLHEIHCTAYINTHNVKLKIDTGAKCSVMPVEIYTRVKAHERINRHNAVNLIAYGCDRFSTLGTVNFRCKIGSPTELIIFQVIDRQANPILGLNDALRLRLVELDKAVYEIGCENNDDFSK